MAGKLITVVQTALFQRRANGILAEREIDGLIDLLAAEPESGDLIRGTEGLRKIRVARRGKGKSGGARVIYYFYSDLMPIFLLTAYAKSRKSDLSANERGALAKAATLIKTTYGA